MDLRREGAIQRAWWAGFPHDKVNIYRTNGHSECPSRQRHLHATSGEWCHIGLWRDWSQCYWYTLKIFPKKTEQSLDKCYIFVKIVSSDFCLFLQLHPVLQRTSRSLRWLGSMSTWAGRLQSMMEEVLWLATRWRNETCPARPGSRYNSDIGFQSVLNQLITT